MTVKTENENSLTLYLVFQEQVHTAYATEQLRYLFHWITTDAGGEVKCVDLSPESDRAYISIDVPAFELRGNELKQFKDMLQYVNKLDFTNTGADSVLIEASVLHVWDAVS